jgi:hypothetical protein
MRKNFKLVFIVLALFVAYQTVCSCDDQKTERQGKPSYCKDLTISIRSDSLPTPVAFNACIFCNGDTLIKLVNRPTPFDTIIQADKLELLFKKVSGESNVECKVSRGVLGYVIAKYPVGIIVIDKENMHTYGLQ